MKQISPFYRGETEAQRASMPWKIFFCNSYSDSVAYTLSVALVCHSGNRNNYQIGNFSDRFKHTPKFSWLFYSLMFYSIFMIWKSWLFQWKPRAWNWRRVELYYTFILQARWLQHLLVLYFSEKGKSVAFSYSDCFKR